MADVCGRRIIVSFRFVSSRTICQTNLLLILQYTTQRGLIISSPGCLLTAGSLD